MSDVPLGELETLMRTMEGACQLVGSDMSPVEAEAELWDARNGMASGGMAANPERSLAGLRRIIRDPQVTPRQAVLAQIMLSRLLCWTDRQ